MCTIPERDTWKLCSQNSKNLRPLDILACKSVKKHLFENPTKNLFAQSSIDVKCHFPFYIYGAMAKNAFCPILKIHFLTILGCNLKGISSGLNGYFLWYLIPILVPSMLITHIYDKNHSGDFVMLLDPWMSPYNVHLLHNNSIFIYRKNTTSIAIIIRWLQNVTLILPSPPEIFYFLSPESFSLLLDTVNPIIWSGYPPIPISGHEYYLFFTVLHLW